MKLLTALIMYFGDCPDLQPRMKAAAKTIEKEAVRNDAILCRETVQAILKYKKGKR